MNIGYKRKVTEQVHQEVCVLTIGSIINFNGQKNIVTHVECMGLGRTYKTIYGKVVDITVGYHGFLKNIATGKEVRSNWHNVVKENILHFEHLELVKSSL